MLVSIDKTVGDLQEICGEHRKPTRCDMDCPLVYICGVMVKDWTVGIIKNEEDTSEYPYITQRKEIYHV